MVGMKLVVAAVAIGIVGGTAGAQTSEPVLFRQASGFVAPTLVWRANTAGFGDEVDGARALTGPRIPWPARTVEGIATDDRGPVDGACALLGKCAGA
jgi:hypothetical protein